MVDADPDFAISNGESHDVVDKGLDLSTGLGHAKDLGEEFLDDAEVSLLFKRGVEGENGPRSFEAVADEIELFHGVQILEMHLDRGTVGRLGHPAVEILTLTGFKKEDVVAIVEFCQFIELVELSLGVEFGLFPAVGPFMRLVNDVPRCVELLTSTSTSLVANVGVGR